MIETITHDSHVYAIIVRRDFAANEGAQFLTSDDEYLQLGVMAYQAGHIFKPHKHNLVSRTINRTQECLLIRSGSMQVDFYSDGNNDLVCSSILKSGDLILLLGGGHGFQVLENVSLIEIKNGPYVHEKDKTWF